MAIGAAIIGGIAAIGSQVVAGKNKTTPTNLDKDQRTTSIDDLFSESFLETLSAQERSALETQISTGTADTTRGSEESQQAINNILSGTNSPNAEAAIQARMLQVIESGAPAIAQSGNAAGSFDSTVKAQLQNDLITQASQAGAQMDLDQKNLQIQQVLAAISASQSGEESQETISDSATGVEETTLTDTEQSQSEESKAIGDALTDVGGSNITLDQTDSPLDQILGDRYLDPELAAEDGFVGPLTDEQLLATEGPYRDIGVDEAIAADEGIQREDFQTLENLPPSLLDKIHNFKGF